jgi:hypothetical protein
MNEGDDCVRGWKSTTPDGETKRGIYVNDIGITDGVTMNRRRD